MSKNSTTPYAADPNAYQPTLSKQVSVLLTEADQSKIKKVAEREMRSISAIARILILESLERREIIET